MAPSPVAPACRAAIVIPHFNDTARLAKCLAALAPQIAGTPVEAVVVDNGSTQDLAPLIAAHPGIRFLAEAEKGAAPARNTGVRDTTASGLAFLDADCVPAPDWVATALRLLDGMETTGQGAPIIGGRVDLFDETPPPRSGAEAFETVFAFPQRDYIERKGFSVTANLVTTRAVFDATGPFEGGVAEDYDWCLRAGRLGYRVAYDADLAVGHPTRNDWPALRRKWQRITSEGYLLNGTGGMARLRWGARALAVLASGPLHAPRILGHSALTGQERGRALATLLHLRGLRAAWMLRQAISGSAPPGV